MAIDSVKIFKDGNGLPRKRHEMLLLHFHTCGWNAPFSLNKVEFGSLSLAELTGANECKDSYEKSAFCFESPLVVADHTYKRADFLGFLDRSIGVAWVPA